MHLARRVESASYGRSVAELIRYADAFGVDRGRLGCWRYVYSNHGHGRPGRCPGQVWWAGGDEPKAGERRRIWSRSDLDMDLGAGRDAVPAGSGRGDGELVLAGGGGPGVGRGLDAQPRCSRLRCSCGCGGGACEVPAEPGECPVGGVGRCSADAGLVWPIRLVRVKVTALADLPADVDVHPPR